MHREEPSFLLHGTLDVTIHEIDSLHTGCGFINFCPKTASSPQKRGKKFLSEVKRLVLCHPGIVGSRLYATIDLDKARVARTRMIRSSSTNIQWNEPFHIYCAHMISNIIFTVKYGNPVGATLIGRAYLPVKEVLNVGQVVNRSIAIIDEEGVPIHGGSRIHVSLKFYDVTRDSNWSQGIKSGSFEGVPRTYFMQRRNCKVKLYQDAHVPDSALPQLVFPEGKLYEAQRCWEDVFDAINDAKHFIYITGWSVYTNITLVRDPKRPKRGGNEKLGELLIRKANEGVRVLVLVWDDRTSIEVFKRDGLMETHDQETADYFRNTQVRCFLCPRIPDNSRTIVQGFEISTMFTHHQKAIVTDAAAVVDGGSHMRKIVSFIGGIDLCDGRYDTPDHSLFRTLNTFHKEDFHQPNFTGSSIKKGGPREPWHDIHCQLEGTIAWDVLYNFEQRWKKQVGNTLLLPQNDLYRIAGRPSLATSSEDPETWNVQLFRSIDSSAVSDFLQDPEEATEIGLVSGKDVILDRSIQDAYISAIRRAKNFIYIENQYFLGSSYGWKSRDIVDSDISALHLIPKELSLKIVHKIEAGERFTVYVVIPMWPEGIPESASVQAILDWQRRTIEMMYKDIAGALQAKGLQADLRDYLTFFCLGNREVKKSDEYEPVERPAPDSDYYRAQQARRFMIYVHAKMMIVDDEYIIVGSANINQRSMDGARDTEIAMGGYQPNHLATDNLPPAGQIYYHRMLLWFEHLGEIDSSFQHPQSLKCVHEVNKVADRNWSLYTDNEIEEDLPSHLLRYPIAVNGDGSVAALPGFEFFPDTKARVLGTKSELLPPILTT